MKTKREEYEVLKELDDKWKWIARDKNGSLFAYLEKPLKEPYSRDWGLTGDEWFLIKEILFQFIQWEDEEPYNIQELIDEYLDDEYGYFNMKLSREFEEFIKKENEGAEMKKGIEWLKREIHKELESWYGVEGGIDEDGINEIMLLIDQLDEPEADNSFYWFTAKKAPLVVDVSYLSYEDTLYGFKGVPNYHFIEHHDLRFITNCSLDDLIEQYK